ncbi:MAG TPA: tRNA uridine-5-carboxymethylaminomethyl(34) synthesis GTPase MnmE [Desulfomicrobiaceae bacterium]|nr:tRNA uridine-5-carboxymethylaminomethyl(34) synthesis GTPase MnmE [Desulfomicrobiaceae bacterium]
MSRPAPEDTIAAIATPLGQGGVGIVRISGSRSRELAGKLFRSARKDFSGFKPYRLHHGWIVNGEGRDLDEVLVSYMPGPGSYTGEDVVEVNCHGGPAVLQLLLETVLGTGARPAEPGEFTKRAFLNGRLDLTQAEAVIEMITAPTRAGVGMAGQKLEGVLGRRISGLRTALEDLRTQLCVAVDFPEEELECLPHAELARRTESVLQGLEELVAGYERNRCWREGVLVVLAGQVNAGKSSLMNAVLGRERAIVTDIPGTTRDYLEEAVSLDGLPVRLVDTAGLRETADKVEQAGVLRSRELLDQADVILLVVDRTRGMADEDVRLLKQYGPDKLVVVENKVDLPGDAFDLLEGPRPVHTHVCISAMTGQGLDLLTDTVRTMAVGTRAEPGTGDLVPNLRQKQGLERAAGELSALLAELGLEMPYDLLSVRLDAACAFLSELTGEITSDEILNGIFDSFCVGK